MLVNVFHFIILGIVMYVQLVKMLQQLYVSYVVIQVVPIKR